MERKNGFNTRLLHDKTSLGYAQREILPPVSQVNAFRYESAEELERVFQHKSAGFAYTRVGNPTTAAFERRINELEGGVGAVAASSGMAAITTALLTVAQSGDEIIAGTGLYGGTIDLFRDFEKLGIRVVYARETSERTIKSLITDKTRAIFAELIGNPSLAILDVPKVSAVAHEAGVPLFVDSTTATPYLVRPLELGADVVIHSTSKYINGGGNSIGGIVVDGGKFPWDFKKHGALSDFSKYGKLAFSVRLRTDLWENFGGCMAPTNAFLSYIGADTLGLRMERICRNAEALANALSELSDVDVNYPTLRGNAFERLAKSELGGRGGGILTFRAGSKERAFKILNALKFAIIASNIGDLRTLVIHPASTLYLHSNREETEAAGVFDDTIRVSVGIEDVDDLVDDFISAIKTSL
ncbi:MAG: O-acetylhomoserine aminocarboxypropyltransferase/cysteine synthase [Thermoguttaceae bacterium]|nr:O-acetylhomoserine aminocarboxypropyltransferase/cysteine synthase [Thermoguttaceae bacterium]